MGQGMNLAGEKSQAFLAMIQATGVVTIVGILTVSVIASIAAGDRPIPIKIQGCYRYGQQTLKVDERHIIANGNPSSPPEFKYQVTNLGAELVMVDGPPLALDLSKAPYEQIDSKTVIEVQNGSLVAYSPQGKSIPFVKNGILTSCRVDRVQPLPFPLD